MCVTAKMSRWWNVCTGCSALMIWGQFRLATCHRYDGMQYTHKNWYPATAQRSAKAIVTTIRRFFAHSFYGRLFMPIRFFLHPCSMMLLLLLLLLLLLFQLAKVFHSTVHIESSISHKYRPQIWENEQTHIHVLRTCVCIDYTGMYTNNIYIGKLLFLLWQIKLFSNLLLSFSID